MIVTVTMNPAVDKTLDVENFSAGAMNRVKAVVRDAGGKGINVSKNVQMLGGRTIACGFLGGGTGNLIGQSLDEMGISHRFIYIDGETRTNVKLVDTAAGGMITEINEPGPRVSQTDIDELLDLLKSLAGPSTIFVFSGSLPLGAGADAYAYMIRRLKRFQPTICADAEGDVLAETIKAKPYLIKPNTSELARYFGLSNDLSEASIIDLGRELISKGIYSVAVSRGKDGAVFFDNGNIYKACGMYVHPHSTVGAGDAMLAALAYGLDAELPFEETARLSIAASAGSCTTIGTKPPAKELVDELVKEVKLEQIG